MIVEVKQLKIKSKQALVVKDDDGRVTAEHVVPVALGALADHLYAVRENRLAIERAAAKLQGEEAAIREHLIATLPKAELATGIAGAIGRVTIKPDQVPRVADWPKLYAHVKKTGAFELLQRRLNEGAVKERWEAKTPVPGVEPFTVFKVSVTKVKG